MTEPEPGQLDAPAVTGSTPTYALPYPETSDSVDVPRDIRALALAVDTKLARPPALALKKASQQPLTTAQMTAVDFTSEALDTSNMWAIANPSVITATVAGWYRFGGGVSFAVSATGLRAVQWFVNGANFQPGQVAMMPPTTPNNAALPAPDLIVNLAVGATMALMAYQSSGATVNIMDAWLSATYVCA
jgi:hypothetical protein